MFCSTGGEEKALLPFKISLYGRYKKKKLLILFFFLLCFGGVGFDWDTFGRLGFSFGLFGWLGFLVSVPVSY